MWNAKHDKSLKQQYIGSFTNMCVNIHAIYMRCFKLLSYMYRDFNTKIILSCQDFDIYSRKMLTYYKLLFMLGIP